ncbi:mediator complex subunit 13 C-terminal-domain-containing protein [Cerioporus squamosus]|nr:mediator complex subunit 13 C-terminal-domain-containing protein [Cerioporus squamosus]
MQFDEALIGLGAGDWKRPTYPRASASDASLDSPTYVVVWLAVQNKRGEDKGMPIIWPANLCVSYHTSSPSAHARSSLPYIPELPAQLQASPPPPTATIPTSLSFASAASPSADIPASSAVSSIPSGERDRLASSFKRRASLLRSSLTSDSLRAFRTLSLSRKPYHRDVRKVATEVNGYVDSVVKERERERERIRRERQEQEIALARAKLASTHPPPQVDPPVPLATNPEPAPAPQQEAPTVMSATPSVSAPVEPIEPESSPAEESEHSADSLFSPPDAAIDLPSTEEEPQTALEEPAEDEPVLLTQAQTTPPLPDPGVGSSSANDDMFHAFDRGWGQQSNGYMDMDYEMDFGMNLDPLGGTRTGGAGGGFDLDDGLPFTDDDFAFFNAPAAQHDAAAPTYPPPLAPVAGMISASAPSLSLTPLTTMDVTLSGPGPPSAGTALPSPWPPHLGEPFTPKGSVDIHGILDNAAPPELLPPSPARTLSSHSAPATPTVHLTEVYHTGDGRSPIGIPLGFNVFDPIPFASSHRQLDGKYAVGKFALPSPPADQDGSDAGMDKSPIPTFVSSWKRKYSAVTDPRIGVVRKLIGVKRKSLDQGTRDQRRARLWESYREGEDWQSSSPPPAEVDTEESDDDPWMEEDEVPLAAAAAPRPSTPPPSYLPLGSSLLRTHFHHTHLLPMCAPLKPPGIVVSNTPGNTAPMSVPTPVSPAAVLGAASEKSKSLEAAAQILVQEVIENPVWSEAWRANASLSFTPPMLPSKAWQADARYIKHVIGGNGSDTTLQTILDTEVSPEDVPAKASLHTLDFPMLALGKGDAVIQLSPTSLRFWEKLGLSPRAGPKDVTAFVFFEGSDEERESEVETWLSKVSVAYTAKNFGAHDAGMSSHCTKQGVVPTRFDTFRKTLMSFVSTIPTRHPNLVFYVATPSHIISPSSTILRQILSAVRRLYKAHPDGDILIHLVPESLILGTHTHPASKLEGLDTFVCSVYDRILRPVTRAMSRKFFNWSAPVVGYFEAPAYSLVSSPSRKSPHGVSHPSVLYSLESSASSLDVTHRHMLLHVGYQVSACGRWIIAACIDAEGEAHELKTWLTPEDNVEAFIATEVWRFGHEFAQRANVEWRIVISKLGLVAHSELEAWVSHLESVVSASTDVPPVHVTLLAVDNENPWTFLSAPERGSFDILKRTPSPAPQMPTSKSRGNHTTFSDAAYTTYFLVPSPEAPFYPTYTAERTSKCGPSHYIPGTAETPFIPDLEDDETSGACAQLQTTEPIRVSGWSAVVCVPSTADYTTLSTVRIYQLHTTRSSQSTYGSSRTSDGSRASPAPRRGIFGGPSGTSTDAQLMSDIVRNFHELAVLSRTRWKLRADPALPFHLAALEVMRAALSGDTVDL